VTVSIKYLNSDDSFSNQFTEYLTGIVVKLLEENGLSGGEVSVIIADNAVLQNLNRQYRNNDAPTDVLSFCYLEPDDQLAQAEKDFAVGDIYISVERAREQAEEAGHNLGKEITLLTVHGMLHLLGYDHGEETGARLMQNKERAVMSEFDSAVSGGETDA